MLASSYGLRAKGVPHRRKRVDIGALAGAGNVENEGRTPRGRAGRGRADYRTKVAVLVRAGKESSVSHGEYSGGEFWRRG